jgi:integrase/recombinase XerD
MSPLRRHLADYLSLRRALGHQLRAAGMFLAQFIDYLDQRSATTITIDHAVGWVTLPPSASAGYLTQRMSAVRAFASYLHTLDAAHQIPPPGLFQRGARRAVPYLYSGADIAALMAAAITLRYPLRQATYQTLIGLLVVSGLRIGEAIRLDDDDVDHARALLTVRDSKFGKTRQVPLHPTTASALAGYQRRRDQWHPGPHAPAVFISPAGTRLLYRNVLSTFVKLVEQAALLRRSAACRPRIHDLRHTAAVATLLDWYADGSDVQARLPLLSTFLGHADPVNTYWYLSAAPELLALAGQRLEDYLAGPS